MCGITGILHLHDQAKPDRSLLHRMNESLLHRGPDGGALHLESGLGLGHRRLSVIDLEGGRQPISNEDDSVWVTFNGEIYNFAELRSELQAAGHHFKTRSDTEVIVHGWEAWGSDCVSRFRGMFAFAVWDRRKQTLFLARDRLGIKPLYYTLTAAGEFVFGSELKALLIHPGVARKIDPAAVDEYFAYGYVPEPRTIFDGIHKLEPAHRLTVAVGTANLPSPEAYWDLEFEPDYQGSVEDAGEELIERLREAVNIRLIADVPLGAFLSGGVDSSAVVAMMAGLSTEPVKTYSIAFGDPRFNEAEHAGAVAKRHATDHHTGEVDPGDIGLVGRLGELFDEPFGDSSAMPTYRVCELARQGVTVALSGDGGDENLAGYGRYRHQLAEERVRRLIPQGIREPLFGTMAAIYPKADWAPKPLRAKATFQALARDSVDAFYNSVSLLRDDRRGHLYGASFRSALQGYAAVEVMRRHASRTSTEDSQSLMQYLDIKTFLVSILHKVDRTSMAHGLEVRVPLLDHQLVEWMARLPPAFKLQAGEGKYLFKKALEPHLPREVMYRPKKGFSVPLASWFRGPLRERLEHSLMHDSLYDSGMFDRGFVRGMIDGHMRGWRDDSASLWLLLVFADFNTRLNGV
ncbi:MAG: XrtA/PEP-CTERM system amidotransferase [Gammaproteobacteria bacterium]